MMGWRDDDVVCVAYVGRVFLLGVLGWDGVGDGMDGYHTGWAIRTVIASMGCTVMSLLLFMVCIDVCVFWICCVHCSRAVRVL